MLLFIVGFLAFVLICFLVDRKIENLKKVFILCIAGLLIFILADYTISSSLPSVPSFYTFSFKDDEKVIQDYLKKDPEFETRHADLINELRELTEQETELKGDNSEGSGQRSISETLKDTSDTLTKANQITTRRIAIRDELIRKMREEVNGKPLAKVRSIIRGAEVCLVLFILGSIPLMILKKAQLKIQGNAKLKDTFVFLFWHLVVLALYDFLKSKIQQ